MDATGVPRVAFIGKPMARARFDAEAVDNLCAPLADREADRMVPPAPPHSTCGSS